MELNIVYILLYRQHLLQLAMSTEETNPQLTLYKLHLSLMVKLVNNEISLVTINLYHNQDFKPV
jgi:hypothetical protein